MNIFLILSFFSIYLPLMLMAFIGLASLYYDSFLPDRIKKFFILAAFPLDVLLLNNKYRAIRYINKLFRILFPTFVIVMSFYLLLDVLLLVIIFICLSAAKLWVFVKKHYLNC